MAIISCPECGSEISDKAQACPKCGCPICAVHTTEPTIKKERSFLALGLLVWPIGIISLVVAFIVGGILSEITGETSDVSLYRVVALSLLIDAIVAALLTFIFSKKRCKKATLKSTKVKNNISIILCAVFAGITLWTAVDTFKMAYDLKTNISLDDAGTYAYNFAADTLKDKLKNPESLIINDVKATGAEYQGNYYVEIILDYSAQNGFGGYDRDSATYYVFINKSSGACTTCSYSEYLDASLGDNKDLYYHIKDSIENG